MAIESKQTITAVGQTDTIDVGQSKSLSFATIGDAADYTADVQVKLTSDGAWLDAVTGIADQTIEVTNGPVVAIRLDLTALGSATTVDFEVCGADQ